MKRLLLGALAAFIAISSVLGLSGSGAAEDYWYVKRNAEHKQPECDPNLAYIENYGGVYVDKNHVATIGFSAGGHLAGMLATITDEQLVKDALKDKAPLAKPDAVILSYPVITLVGKAHHATGDNLCGEDMKLKEYLSLDKRVTPSSVPAFIWSTVNDQIVPVESSLYMASAYRENGVPFELHIFEDGIHGLSLANEEVDAVNVPVQAWKGACTTWLKSRGFELIKRSI